MAAALPWVKPRFYDIDGKPLSGGKVWCYQAGTSTPIASYTDSTGTVPNTNPVILDSEGYGDIWLAPGSYKIVLMDANDVVQFTKDKVKPADGGGGGILDSDYIYTGYSARFSEIFATTGLNDTLAKIIKLTYTGPAISLSATGNGTVREKGTVVSSTVLSAAVTMRSNAIAQVRFYDGATLIDTESAGGAIPSGGTSSYTYSTSFSDNKTFNAQVDDVTGGGGPTTASASASFTFVYPYYYGHQAANLTAAQVRSLLTNDIRVSSASVQINFTTSGGEVPYFAYPASYGVITSVKDVNNFEVFPSFKAVRVQNITGLDGTAVSYNIYEGNNILTAGSYQLTFIR